MKILLLKNENIDTFELPKKSVGNIWLTIEDEIGNTKNLINIESTIDGNWKLISNNECYIILDSKKVDQVILNENSFYMIKETSSDKIFHIYSSKTYETMDYYSVSTELLTGISIGTDENSKIRFNGNFISKNHATLIMQGDDVFLKDLNQDGGNIYVNDIKIFNSIKINYGDLIFINGLKLILLKINGIYILGVSNSLSNLHVNLEKYNINKDNSNEAFEEDPEEKNMFVYSQSDYFHKKPRLLYKMDEAIVKVDAPPSTMNSERMPLIITIGPMMTMSLTSAVMLYSTINNIITGEKTLEESYVSLITSGVMMVSFLVWPLITNLFQKHFEKKKEKKRKEKYREYLDSKSKEIIKLKEDQERILRKKYPDLKQCEEIVLKKDSRMWERKVENDDFLSVSLGNGSFPMKLDLKLPEDHFTVDYDELKDDIKKLEETDKNLKNVPFEFSFLENYISSIIGQRNLSYKLINNIIFQLTTFHSYDNLKLAVFTNKQNEHLWKDLSILPHFWSNDKSIRFFASNQDEYKELSYNLERVLQERIEYVKENDSEHISFNPTFLIITDSFTSIRNLEFVNNLLNQDRNLGFSITILAENTSVLPDQCQTFIQLDNNVSHVYNSVEKNENSIFTIDNEIVNYDECYKILSNTPIEIKDNTSGLIPKKLGFLEMYEIGKVEQFNSLSRWKKNTPVSNMNAIVGVGKSGEKINLDLHEKFHGPHGLIAGMTGSGKSEFIITYILSMAVNYHPYEVQFILIDYKGGGLAGAFENKTLGYKLPHLVGVITNLDKTEINRSLQSIESELKRRQRLFNEAREISGESTVDIYKYQKMYRNNIVKEPVSHLFIIADEFAELKTQQPEFMDQLISTARIGRSLGVHLILATQKPSGVVDSQIWSNTRFRVCLRVQEKSDSTEVIQCPDAAFLTQTGRFYLQVGYNEIFELGQSAWAGGKYIPSESIKKTIDSSINFINNSGYVINSIETKDQIVVVNNKGEELGNIVKYLDKLAKEEQINTKPLWLEKMSGNLTVEDLIKKYSYEKEKYNLNPIIGEYDVPNRQEQHLLTLSFNKNGNTIVYGSAGSGKENFITTMIYSSMLIYTPEEVNYYILDFGAEILNYFKNSPIVGDVVHLEESEKISNLFKNVTNLINERKKLFADYNGDFYTYSKSTNNIISSVVVVINNYEAFSETYEEYADKLIEITRDCIKYGVYFVLTSNVAESIRFKLKQNFGNIFSLQQNNDDDYITIFGNIYKTYPSKIYGRGIFKDDRIYEFQTALVSSKDKLSSHIKNLSEKLSKIYSTKASKIQVLPETVVYENMDIDNNSNDIIIGIEKENLVASKIDFTKKHTYVITSSDYSLINNFITSFIYQYSQKQNVMPVIINADDYNVSNESKEKVSYYDNDFDSVFNKVIGFLTEVKEKYEANNFDKSIINKEKKVSCIILGINSFKTRLSSDNKAKFDELFNTLNEFDLINFIIVDTVDKIKNFQYDTWYKSNISQNEGIYIGTGISEQYVINISNRLQKNEIDNNFCYVVNKGKAVLVKYIEEISE